VLLSLSLTVPAAVYDKDEWAQSIFNLNLENTNQRLGYHVHINY
jgi:hypothetical protein